MGIYEILRCLDYQFGNAGQDDIERNLEENLHKNKSWNHGDDIIIQIRTCE